MKFLHEIKSSVYDPAFYAEKRTVSGGKAFGYFIKISVIYALVLNIFFSFAIVPMISGIFSQKGIDTIAGSFPADLQITIKGGQVSTNVTEPYSIPLPANLNVSASSKGTSHEPKNILVIDTKSTSPLDSFAQYDTDFLLTKEYIIAQKSNGQITVQKLDSIPDTIINQAKISDWISKLHPLMLVFVPLMILLVLVFMFIFIIIGNAIFLLVYSFIVWIVQKIRKSNMTYGQTYKLGFYALTLPLALDLIFSVCGLHMPWYVDALVFLVVMFSNLKVIKKLQSAV